jgi:Cu/Ag efflux protein CusF
MNVRELTVSHKGGWRKIAISPTTNRELLSMYTCRPEGVGCSGRLAHISGDKLMRSKKFWLISGIAVLVTIALVSYWLLRPVQPQIKHHIVTGYVLEVTPEMNRITVRNADMPGTMASMVMDYQLKDAAALGGVKPGDVIQATMVVDDGYWLEGIKVTGRH